MKNFKQIAFGLIIGALAISFSAFTTPKKLAGDWYTLKTSVPDITTSDSRAQDINNYDLGSQQVEQPDCGGFSFVCAARFNNGTDHAPTTYSLKDE